MKKIEVFDIEYERLNAIAERRDLWIAQVIEMLLDEIDEEDEERIFG